MIFSTLAALGLASAADTDAWKARSVYQILTDRFAQDSPSTQACGNLSNYCGGTYKGIMNNLDYI